MTPNHLLLLSSNDSLPWSQTDTAEVYRRRWRHVQSLASQFWKQWLRQYLPELQRRPKWLKVERSIQKGDLVLVSDQVSPRGSWPLALVMDTTEGRDGLVRSARLKTKTSVLVRPISKLILLEGST